MEIKIINKSWSVDRTPSYTAVIIGMILLIIDYPNNTVWTNYPRESIKIAVVVDVTSLDKTSGYLTSESNIYGNIHHCKNIAVGNKYYNNSRNNFVQTRKPSI